MSSTKMWQVGVEKELVGCGALLQHFVTTIFWRCFRVPRVLFRFPVAGCSLPYLNSVNSSRDCLNFYMLHGNMQAIFLTWKISGACMKTFCRITMQPPLFELKLKTIPHLHRCDDFVFTRKLLK